MQSESEICPPEPPDPVLRLPGVSPFTTSSVAGLLGAGFTAYASVLGENGSVTGFTLS